VLWPGPPAAPLGSCHALCTSIPQSSTPLFLHSATRRSFQPSPPALSSWAKFFLWSRRQWPGDALRWQKLTPSWLGKRNIRMLKQGGSLKWWELQTPSTSIFRIEWYSVGKSKNPENMWNKKRHDLGHMIQSNCIFQKPCKPYICRRFVYRFSEFMEILK